MSKIEDTLAQRGSAYGDFREQGRITQNLKRAMQDSPNWGRIPAYMREGLDMVQHKVSRILNGNPFYDDNFHDMVGYTKLMQDRAAQDVDNGVAFEAGGDPMYPAYDHEEGKGPATMSNEIDLEPVSNIVATVRRVTNILNHCRYTKKNEAVLWVKDIENLVESPTQSAAILIKLQRAHVENIQRIANLTDVSDADKIAQIKQAMGDV